MPTGKIVPVSMMAFVIAESGERKSTIENAAMSEIREFQKKEQQETTESLKEWEEDYKIWKRTLERLRNTIANMKVEGEDDEIYSARLKTHLTTEPIRPTCFRLLYESTTQEALLQGLDKNYPYASLVSSEGGMLLDSKVMTNLPAINSIWSGDTVTVDTKTSGSIHLSGARLSMLMMAQPGMVKRYLEKSKGAPKDSGFLARTLVCCPPTKAGSRTINNLKLSSQHEDAYTKKLRDILDLLKKRKPDEESAKIRLSAESQVLWLEIANGIEGQINSGGRFFNVQDHASKLADIICRVAAIVHCYESNFNQEISVETLRSSISICFHFSDQFLNVFNAPPEYVYNAQILDNWLQQFRAQGVRYVKKNSFLQGGPRPIRKKIKLDEAIGHLFNTGRVRLLEHKNINIIDLMPWNIFIPGQLEHNIGIPQDKQNQTN
tara:strand:+ start:11235 stop:12539 length:1305 start_codon:yes stop_codon:yes gene_type:complete